jgi:hypothetical protein
VPALAKPGVYFHFDQLPFSPSAEFGLQPLLSEGTHSEVCDPGERVEMANPKMQSSEAAVLEIRPRSRRKFSLEEKIRILLEGFRGE